jgi:hypothetical protein
MPFNNSKRSGASSITRRSISSVSSVEWGGGRLRADVRGGRIGVWVVLLVAITGGVVPSTTSLLVADGVTHTDSSSTTDVRTCASDHGS